MNPRRESAYPRHPGRHLFSESEWKRIKGQLDLSDREYEIARLIVEGCQRKSIARSIRISVHTVHSHLRRLFDKVEVDSSVELVARIVHEFRRRGLNDQSEEERRPSVTGADAQ